MYQRNPTTTCPNCGTGNRENRDSCWKCHWELNSNDSLPYFGRPLKSGLRSNPWDEDIEEDDLDDDVIHHDFSAPSHHAFKKQEWAKGTYAYRRNPSHPIFRRRNPDEMDESLPMEEEKVVTHRRNPWLDDSSTGLSWLNDGLGSVSSTEDHDDDGEETPMAWARQNVSPECVRCGDETADGLYCEDCKEVKSTSLRRRNPWRNTVQRRYLKRLNPSSPAWMQSLYPSQQGVWGRPTFDRAKKNPGRGYMRRRNPAWMKSLYPENQGVWGSSVFSRRRNPAWMQSLYPENQGVWGTSVFNRRRNPEWMKSLYPEGQGVWGSAVFNRNNPWDEEDEDGEPNVPSFRKFRRN